MMVQRQTIPFQFQCIFAVIFSNKLFCVEKGEQEHSIFAMFSTAEKLTKNAVYVNDRSVVWCHFRRPHFDSSPFFFTSYAAVCC